MLLITDDERFSSLLRACPGEMDLRTVGRLQVTVGSAADDLHAALKELPLWPVTGFAVLLVEPVSGYSSVGGHQRISRGVHGVATKAVRR
jgi:hypothetical protein